MGPGGCQEPGRDQGLPPVVAELQVAAVSSADILAQPAVPLNAAYWTTKHPGETYTAWRARQECEDLERRGLAPAPGNHPAGQGHLAGIRGPVMGRTCGIHGDDTSSGRCGHADRNARSALAEAEALVRADQEGTTPQDLAALTTRRSGWLPGCGSTWRRAACSMPGQQPTGWGTWPRRSRNAYQSRARTRGSCGGRHPAAVPQGAQAWPPQPRDGGQDAGLPTRPG